MSALRETNTMVAPEALSLIELGSVAAGTRAVDALLKKAPVRIERVGTLQPGRFAVLMSGQVASVSESHAEALRVGGAAVLDEVLLPRVEPSVYRAAMGERTSFGGDTLGIIETDTLAAVIEAADTAVKGALVQLAEIRLGDGLGGKGLAHLLGEQHDVEAAVELATARVAAAHRSINSSVTPRLDAELRAELDSSTRFWGGRG